VTLVVFVRTNVLLYLCIPEFTVCCGMLLKNRLRHSVIRTMCATTFFFFKDRTSVFSVEIEMTNDGTTHPMWHQTVDCLDTEK